MLNILVKLMILLFLLFIPIRSSSRVFSLLRAKWVDADRSQLETRTEPVKGPKDISIAQLVCFLASFHVIQFRGSASTLVNRDNGAVKQLPKKSTSLVTFDIELAVREKETRIDPSFF